MKQRKPTSRVRTPRSPCPIANTLDILGDKWTLLVVRDLLFLGKRLYGEFMQSGEGIPTNILADRLKRLEETGLVTKEPYQSNPPSIPLDPEGRRAFPGAQGDHSLGQQAHSGNLRPARELLGEIRAAIRRGAAEETDGLTYRLAMTYSKPWLTQKYFQHWQIRPAGTYSRLCASSPKPWVSWRKARR